MTNVYAITNQKGGVGKSKLGVNLSAYQATKKGRKVLLIDLDPQGHATKGLGLRKLYFEDRDSLHELLVPKISLPGQAAKEIRIDRVVMQPPTEDFFMVISNIKMILVEQDLVSVRGREYRLTTLISQLQGIFDDIIIDCPPNLGILTDNAILATLNTDPASKNHGGIIIPILADQESMEALDLLLSQIESLEKALNVTVNKLAIVPNMVQDSGLARGILKGVRSSTPITLDFNMPKRVVVQEANAAGCSIFKYIPRDSSKRKDALEMQEAYGHVMEIIEERCMAHV